MRNASKLFQPRVLEARALEISDNLRSDDGAYLCGLRMLETKSSQKRVCARGAATVTAGSSAAARQMS